MIQDSTEPAAIARSAASPRLLPLLVSAALALVLAVPLLVLAWLGTHPPREPSGGGAAALAVALSPEGKVPFRVPDRATLPEGPLGDAIRRGEQLALRTREELPEHVGNGLHCASCHLQAGTVAGAGPWVGLAGVFPEYRARNARINTLEMRVNDCFERSMNGTPLDPTSPEMAAFVAYIGWLSRDVPAGREVEGRGFRRIADPPEPDEARGQALYASKCAVCHGENGEGRDTYEGAYQFPALWGDRSFNLGAGMARLDTAAAYVRWNMPLGQGGTLTDQEAYDVAAFFTRQPRPDFARKHEDWPQGGKPRDARY